MFDCVSMCASVWMSGLSSMGMHVKHDVVVLKIVFIAHAQLRLDSCSKSVQGTAR